LGPAIRERCLARHVLPRIVGKSRNYKDIRILKIIIPTFKIVLKEIILLS
jgi:hypothetical protein